MGLGWQKGLNGPSVLWQNVDSPLPVPLAAPGLAVAMPVAVLVRVDETEEVDVVMWPSTLAPRSGAGVAMAVPRSRRHAAGRMRFEANMFGWFGRAV